LRAAADLKGLSPDIVAEKTTQNARLLFGITDR
jgi:hypothetical protein